MVTGERHPFKELQEGVEGTGICRSALRVALLLNPFTAERYEVDILSRILDGDAPTDDIDGYVVCFQLQFTDALLVSANDPFALVNDLLVLDIARCRDILSGHIHRCGYHAALPLVGQPYHYAPGSVLAHILHDDACFQCYHIYSFRS